MSAAAFALSVGACNQRPLGQAANEETNMKTIIIPIEGMSCAACAASVKKALTSIDGVADVQVNLAERNARVRFAPSKLSTDRLVGAVNGLGFKARTPAELP
jgi:Cu+-exporting ATPase